jgi:ParB/RepB/Spo0J family partition protein
MLEYIPLSKLVDPRKPLRMVNRHSVEYRELADDVRKNGILQPLLVRPLGDGRYEVTEGAHRLQAAREAKLETVPCLIREMTDYEASIIQLKAQAIRPKTTTMEFANRLQELLDGGITTLAQLSQDIGKSVVWIRDILKLNKLCPEAKAALNRNEIPLASARELARLPRGLQNVLLPSAAITEPASFKELVRAHLKSYRELIKTGRIENYVLKVAKPQPYLRTMTEIRHEVDTYREAGIHIELQGAKTPLEGWKACIVWLMHLDPISLKIHEDRNILARAEKANALKRRKLDRDLRNKLIKGDDNDN